MMKTFISLILIFTFLLAACKEKTENVYEDTVPITSDSIYMVEPMDTMATPADTMRLERDSAL